MTGSSGSGGGGGQQLIVLRSTSTSPGGERSEEVNVVVSRSVLVRESQVFRVMLSDNWNTGGRDSSEPTETDSASTTTDNNSNNSGGASGAENETGKPAKHSERWRDYTEAGGGSGPTTRRRASTSAVQSSAVIVDVTGFENLAVKVLFEYMQGFTAMMRSKLDFDVLVDMLRLCDFYDMPRYVQPIADKIKADLKIDETNLVHVLNTTEALRSLGDMLAALCDVLVDKCAAYAAESLPIGHKTIRFVLANGDNADCLLRLFGEVLKYPENVQLLPPPSSGTASPGGKNRLGGGQSSVMRTSAFGQTLNTTK